MGIHLEQGRTFASRERECSGDSPIIIDDVLARRFFSGEPALGKHLGTPGCPQTIVGVAAASKKADLAAFDRGAVYEPYGTHAPNDLTIVVRTALSLASASRAMRDAVAAIDSTVAVGEISPLRRGLERSVGPQRLASNVLSALAALAAAVAAVGLFAVLSYATTQRLHELGIRAALGASPQSLVRLVLSSGVSPRAPGTIAVGLVGVVAVALVACWLPARRAAVIDPARTLRLE